MSTHSISSVAASDLDVMELNLVLRREQHAPELKRLSVPKSFISDIHAEMWRDDLLRRGQPDTSFSSLTFRTIPETRASSPSLLHCFRAFAVECARSSGEVFRRTYSAEAFSDVAAGAIQELVRQGVLGVQDTFYYELNAAQASALRPPPPQQPSINLVSREESLSYVSVPLESLRSQSQWLGDPDRKSFPVVYTEQAFAHAEKCSRRGAELHPPCESGCALAGFLCSCPVTGEFFPVVTDAFEALDAEESEVSLVYSGKTWRRLQTVVSAKQSHLGTNAYRILGQAHGHNFLPAGGAPPCELCDKAAVCGRTSVFASLDDRLWSQSVFARQPWALCHIFGLNARRENVHGLFTLRENRFVQRGFYLVKDFDPHL